MILDYGIKDIGNYAFYECSSLTEITIPATVTSIGKYAFADCYSLTKITIPESVENIGKYAFQYMGGSNTGLERHSITVVYNAHCEMPQTMFHGTIIETLIITYADGIVPLLSALSASQVGDIYVPDTLVNDYKAAEFWSIYTNRIKPLSEYKEDY